MRGLGFALSGFVWLLTALACAGTPPPPGPSVGAPAPAEEAGRGKRGGGGGRKRGGGAPSPSPSPAPSPGGGTTICFASGVYTTCETSNGWESCSDHAARAGGEGQGRNAASAVALDECTAHMLTMIINANGGGGSGSIKSGCAVTDCTP